MTSYCAHRFTRAVGDGAIRGFAMRLRGGGIGSARPSLPALGSDDKKIRALQHRWLVGRTDMHRDASCSAHIQTIDMLMASWMSHMI